ncbi:MAG: hypothetical protein ACREHD_24485 [Pirellulales bacterium]
MLFDLEHDYIPRRIAVYGDGQTYDRWHQSWDVESIQQVRDELAGAPRWFPKSAVFIQPDREHRLEILEMTLNARIDPALFTPDPLPGTRVTDVTMAKHKDYVVGGMRAASQLIEQKVRSARDEIAAADGAVPSSTSYNARPEGSAMWWKLLGVFSLATLAAAFCIHWYRSR